MPFMILLLCIAVYKYGYVRVQADLASLREQQELKEKTLMKYISFIAGKPDIEKQIVKLKDERAADESKLIEGQTPSIAGANLQDIIKEIITGKGGTISSERMGKPEDIGKFRIISVSIDAVLPDSKALSDILYSIETRTPYLIVKDLDTRVRNFKDPKELMVKMDVKALTSGK